MVEYHLIGDNMDIKLNTVKTKVNDKLKEQKKIYIFIIIVMLLGLISGIIYAVILNKNDHTIVKDSLDSFFLSIKDNNIDYKSALINSLIGNITFTTFIFLLGISIIGIPIIILSLFLKTFIFGFSISSIIYTYHLNGILKAITYTLPHQLITILMALFLGFYALYFGIKLFKYLFRGKDINLRHSMKRYLQVYITVLIINIACSLIEVFLSPTLIKLVI